MQPRVLLLSAYAAASHRLWSTQLQQLFPEFAWTVLELPPRHFNWTIRGNSLLWGFSQRSLLQQPFDLLVATSMVDLSSLRGFVPALSRLPTLVYFHENQFAYPEGSGHATIRSEPNVEPQLVPLYAALCADRVVFNSHYNRNSFLQGARSLVRRLPDRLPAEVLLRLENSEVVPVPVPAPLPCNRLEQQSAAEAAKILEVVWNHRWEYDKGIDLLLALCRQLQTEERAIRLHIVGEQFRQQPQEFQQIDTLLREQSTRLHIDRGHFGFIPERAGYEALLGRCDVVLSTARHDF